MASFEIRKAKDGKKRIKARVKVTGFPRKSRNFATMEKARVWAVKTESEMLAGRGSATAVSDHHTVAEMIERYMDKVMPYKTKKKRYICQQTQQLRWWKKEIGKYTLTNVKKPVIIEKRDELRQQVGPATVNRYLAAISHVFGIAVNDWEWLAVSPISKGMKLKEPRGRARYLKDDERPTFLEACKMEQKKPLFLIAVLVIATGARKEEITALPLRNLDIARGMATTEETKNSEPKTFFFTGFALALLKQYAEHNKHFKRKYLFSNRTGKRPMLVDREFRRARVRAGVDDFVFHDLRHTHASYMAMETNADPKTIADALGQKTVNQATRYTHLTRRHVAGKQEEMNNKIFGKDIVNADS